jgi:nucleotide-binding universal stress UspA family protein
MLAGKPGIGVVGVDDSSGSRAALDFALREGLAHGDSVEVVTAWRWSSPYDGVQRASTEDAARDATAAMQDALVQEALDRLPDRPRVSQIVVHDYSGKALVTRSDGARMLVVGSGRKGALSRGLLGSVSEYCVRHAPVPVTVVPDPLRTVHTPAPEIEQMGLGASY